MSPRAPVTLELARRFHSRGDEVFLCDSLRFACANFSRSKHRSFLVPRPKQATEEYVAALNKIVERERIDLIVPTCEEIFYLAAYQKQIACRVFVDSFEKLHQIHNKWTFSQKASSAAGRSPESFLIQEAQDLRDYRERSKEFVFKPVYSRFGSETLIRPDANRLESIEVNTAKPWIAQRFIAGQEFSTYSIAWKGTLHCHCTYRSTFRAGVGAGICFRAEEQPAILEFTKQFVSQFEFSGQLGLDLILDDGGNVWALEGNPRATSGAHLFGNDATFVDTMRIVSMPERPGQLLEARAGSSHMVGAAMLTFGLLDSILQRRLFYFLRQLFSSHDVLFRWSDPLPMLGLPLTIGELCWIAASCRKSLQQASTLDIEWNGEPIRNESQPHSRLLIREKCF
jgi:glutathione synthase/RimK-type ligase-like ATP-grasp enzyme